MRFLEYKNAIIVKLMTDKSLVRSMDAQKGVSPADERGAALANEVEIDENEVSIQPPLSLKRSWTRRLARLTIPFVLLYAAICAALVCLETRLVFPGAYFSATPALNAERFTRDQPIHDAITTLEYRAEDGAELRGRIVARAHPDRVILFLHGNGIRAVDLDEWTQRLADVANASVMTAEYRGFQNDGFTPTESSTIDDAVSAVDAFAQATGVSPQDITIYGRSLGGGVAAGLVEVMQARGAPPKSLILDRTFDSAMHVGADRYFWLPVKWLIRNPYNSSERLRDFQGNVVSSHGTPDVVVPMKNGRALFDSLTTPHKTWIEIPNLHHNDRMSDQTLRQEFDALAAMEQTKTP